MPCSGCPASRAKKSSRAPTRPSTRQSTRSSTRQSTRPSGRAPTEPSLIPVKLPSDATDSQPTATPEAAKQSTVTPETVKRPTVAPEPVNQPAVPEPATQSGVVPELGQPNVVTEPGKQPVPPAPGGQPTVVSEPAGQPTVVPEPVRQSGVVPEPAKQATVVPEPVGQPNVVSEPVTQSAAVPQPVRQQSVVPAPVRQSVVNPEQPRQPNVVPELDRRPAAGVPEPERQPAMAPEGARRPTVTPLPAKQPYAAPVRQPSMPQPSARPPSVARQPIPAQPNQSPRPPNNLPPPSKYTTPTRIPPRNPGGAPEFQPEKQTREPRLKEASPTMFLNNSMHSTQPSTYQSILKLCENILHYCPCENDQYDDNYTYGPCQGTMITQNLRCPFRGEDDQEQPPKKTTTTENKAPYRIEVASGVTLCLDDKLRQFMTDPCPCAKLKELKEEEAARNKKPSAQKLGPQDVALATQRARAETMEAYEQAYGRVHREPSVLRQVGGEQYSAPVHPNGQLTAYETVPVPRERTLESLYTRPSQIQGPYEHVIGPYQQAPFGRMDVPYARMETPYARMEAPYSRMEVPFALMESPYARMETPYEQQGNPYEQSGTLYDQTSGPQGQKRGSSYGGSQKHMVGCSYGQMGDNQRQKRGCGCKTDQMSNAQAQQRGSSFGCSTKPMRGSSYAQMVRTPASLRRGYGQTRGSQAQASLCSYGPSRSPQAQPRLYPTAQPSASRHRQMNSYGPYGQYVVTPYGQAAISTYGHLGGLQGPTNGYPYVQMPGPQTQINDEPNGQIVNPEQITGNCYLQVSGPSTSRSGILTPTYYRNPQRTDYVVDNMEPDSSYDDYQQETGANTLFNKTSIQSGCWLNPPEPRYRKELRKMKSAIAQTMSKHKLKRKSQISRDVPVNQTIWT